MTVILTIREGEVVVFTTGNDMHIVTSKRDLEQYLQAVADANKIAVSQLNVMCSSTLDFPEEYTSDPQTIALAKEIR